MLSLRIFHHRDDVISRWENDDSCGTTKPDFGALALGRVFHSIATTTVTYSLTKAIQDA